ncbi:hypothetical protein SO802_001351 [Lithocarpus litseifolius]|uniref:CCHC-type domain-containing protein n=1 Tax=Lithocarpus litseifolius TaxID=425828 RepID=A0AAW2DWU0_9ROSI
MEVSDLIARTEKCSCLDACIELPPNQSATKAPSLILLGKLISCKALSPAIVSEVVNRAWRPTFQIQVKQVDKNVFTFCFHHETDLQNAFNRRPWSIRGGHLVLKQWSPSLAWQEVSFSSSTFWVQVHGLPELWKSPENIRKLGEKAGKVLEVDLVGESSGSWKRFIRVQVEVDILQPLMPGVFLPRGDLPTIWIGLKYEKLADVCYRCGLVGHESRYCQGNAFLLRNPFGSDFAAAGPWLRAENNAIPSEAFSKPNLTVAPVDDVTGSQSVPQGQRKDHCPQNDTVPQVCVASQYTPQLKGHYASPQYQSTPQCTTVAVESSCHQQTSPPPHTSKPILCHSNLPQSSHNPQAHFSNPQSEPNTTPNDPSPTFPPGFGPSIEVTKNDFPTQKYIHPSSQPNLISTSPVIPTTSTDSPLYQNTQEQIIPTSLPQTSLPLSLSSSQKNTHNNFLPQKRKNSDRPPRRVRKAKVVEERHIASSESDPTVTGGLIDESTGKYFLDICSSVETTTSKTCSVTSTAAEEAGLIKPPTSP